MLAKSGIGELADEREAEMMGLMLEEDGMVKGGRKADDEAADDDNGAAVVVVD